MLVREERRSISTSGGLNEASRLNKRGAAVGAGRFEGDSAPSEFLEGLGFSYVTRLRGNCLVASAGEESARRRSGLARAAGHGCCAMVKDRHWRKAATVARIRA